MPLILMKIILHLFTQKPAPSRSKRVSAKISLLICDTSVHSLLYFVKLLLDSLPLPGEVAANSRRGLSILDIWIVSILSITRFNFYILRF
jgi:hypothetical protein